MYTRRTTKRIVFCLFPFTDFHIIFFIFHLECHVSLSLCLHNLVQFVLFALALHGRGQGVRAVGELEFISYFSLPCALLIIYFPCTVQYLFSIVGFWIFQYFICLFEHTMVQTCTQSSWVFWFFFIRAQCLKKIKKSDWADPDRTTVCGSL